MARRKIEKGLEESKRVDTDPGEPRIEYMALGVLEKWPRNPKEHDFDYLGGSFKRFGFVAPPMIDEGTGRLVAGHGRLEKLAALKAAGEKPPTRIRVDAAGEWWVPVLRGIRFRDAREAEAWLISDNEGPGLGGWKDRELLELLEDHRGDLEGTGFDVDRVDELAEKLASMADDVPEVEDLEEREPRTELAYEDRYALVVSCKSEDDQKATFERLREMGFEVKLRFWRVAAKVVS